jgi:hypothetical protein
MTLISHGKIRRQSEGRTGLDSAAPHVPFLAVCPPEHCVLQLLERGNSSSRPAVANTSSIGRVIV